jgi:hypothetical protein
MATESGAEARAETPRLAIRAVRPQCRAGFPIACQCWVPSSGPRSSSALIIHVKATAVNVDEELPASLDPVSRASWHQGPHPRDDRTLGGPCRWTGGPFGSGQPLESPSPTSPGRPDSLGKHISELRNCGVWTRVRKGVREPGDAIVAGLPPAKERNGAQPARASSMADSTCFASPTTATLAVFMMGAFSSTLRATMNLAS